MPHFRLGLTGDQRAFTSRQIVAFDPFDVLVVLRDLPRVLESQRLDIDWRTIKSVIAKNEIQHEGNIVGGATGRLDHSLGLLPRTFAICLIFSRVSGGIELYSRKNAVSTAASSVTSSRPIR